MFDDPNLVGSAGLLPVLRLAEAAGSDRLLTAQLTVACPNAAAKAWCVLQRSQAWLPAWVLRRC